MKAIYFLMFLIIFLLSSCSDLNLSKINCEESSAKCPSNTICIAQECITCPEGSIKKGDTCNCIYENYKFNSSTWTCEIMIACSSFDNCDNKSICYNGTCRKCPEGASSDGDSCDCGNNQYFYKEKNKCESTACTSTDPEDVTRVSSCQSGLGYCFKENDTEICKANTCTTNLDCKSGENCTFSFKEENTLPYLTCVKTGSTGLGEECNEDNGNYCKEGLTCVEEKEDEEDTTSPLKKTCEKICIPDNTGISSCGNDTLECLDFKHFNEDTPANLIGACAPKDQTCKFTESGNHIIQVHSSCNDNKGICFRVTPKNFIGYCQKDECNPSVRTDCTEEGHSCVYHDLQYQCLTNDDAGDNAKDEECNEDIECKTGLICVLNGESKKVCKKTCKPNNIYGYDDCGFGYTCVDVKNRFQGDGEPDEIAKINYGVLGICAPSSTK